MANIIVANPLQVNYNVPQGANAVLADEIPDDMAVIMEKERFKAIELARRLDGVDLVKNEVIVDAITRQHVIVARHSGMEAAPVWANAMVTQIQGMLNARIGQLEGALDGRLAQIQAKMGQMLATMGQMQARAEADRARVQNSHIKNPNHHLYPVLKYKHHLVPQTLKGIRKVNTARMNAIYWFYNDPLLAPGGQNLDARL